MKVKQIACGNDYSMFLTEDGRVYGLGTGIYHQLGLDESKDPVFIPNIHNASQVVCGQYHTFFLTTDGNVYGLGNNYGHQLGLSISTTVTTPTLIPLNDRIVQIASNDSYTLFLASNGRVYGCGYNEYKQLGLQGKRIYTPTLIPNLYDITQVSCGDRHALFLTSDGHVYGCGINYAKQLGLQDDSISTPTLIPILDNIIQIVASKNYSMFLRSDGRVYGTGDNTYSQMMSYYDRSALCIPTLIPNIYDVVQIACGDDHTFFLTVDGDVYGIGTNDKDEQLCIDSDDDVVYTPTKISNIHNIVQVSCSSEHALFLTTYDRIYGCGSNEYDQLGVFNMYVSRTY